MKLQTRIDLPIAEVEPRAHRLRVAPEMEVMSRRWALAHLSTSTLAEPTPEPSTSPSRTPCKLLALLTLLWVMLRERVSLSAMAVNGTLRSAGVNTYPPPDAPVHRPRYTGALIPTLDNVYDGFFVDLAPGQALRITGEPPVARYVSFVFYDRWFNTPDFPTHSCYRTLDDLERSSEGTYEMILGPDDPGHPNWIDTGGLRQGIFAIRCLLPEQRHLPDVEIIDAVGGPVVPPSS